MLITDATRATSINKRISELGEQKVIIKNGGQVILKDGTLAGSIITMYRAICTMVEKVGVILPHSLVHL